MSHPLPPGSYEDLTRAIHDRYGGLSPTYQKLALFVTQNPNDVAVLSASALAARCGVHPSSLVRFAQHFGYRGFKELQILFRARLATAAPGFEARIEALRNGLPGNRHDGLLGFVEDLVVRDIASLEELLATTQEADLRRAVDVLDRADAVYLIGQLRSDPVVSFLRYVLTMLGRRTVLLDPGGGLATHMAKLIRPRDVLLAVSFRFYATEVINIAEDAAARDVPIVAISDSTLSPLAKSATVLFTVREHEHSFSRSLAAPMCLAQALMIALAAKLQRDIDRPPRIPMATQPRSVRKRASE